MPGQTTILCGLCILSAVCQINGRAITNPSHGTDLPGTTRQHLPGTSADRHSSDLPLHTTRHLSQTKSGKPKGTACDDPTDDEDPSDINDRKYGFPKLKFGIDGGDDGFEGGDGDGGSDGDGDGFVCDSTVQAIVDAACCDPPFTAVTECPGTSAIRSANCMELRDVISCCAA